MAFPSAGTPVSTAFGSSVTSMAVTMPATVSSGDRLVAVSSIRNAATWSTVPTGFTQLKLQAGGGSVGDLTVFEKIADGTEGGTTKTWVASTATTAVWQVIRVTSANASTASEVASTNGDATNANPPSLTPSGGSNDYLWIAVASNGATGDTTGFTAAPTNYSGLQSNGGSSGGATVNIATATRQLTASSEDPGAFTPSSNRFWAAATIAIYPASGGAVNASIAQVAASVTAAGGTQTVAAVQTVSISQSAASITATGGTQSTNIGLPQSAANLTATGGTQSVLAGVDASVAQIAATLTASGGTQSIATVNIVAISQVAANITASGGTQSISTVNIVAISQVAASITASGGNQGLQDIQDASVAQSAAILTVTGGVQGLATTGGTTTGYIQVWSGSAFSKKPVKVWNGSSWQIKPMKRWNGTTWVTTS